MPLVQRSPVRIFLGDSSSADARITLGSPVTATNFLLHRVAAFRYSTATLGLIALPTTRIGGTPTNTWARAIEARKVSETGSNHQTAVAIDYAMNVAAGTTEIALDATYEDASTIFAHVFEEWSGVATTLALDKTGAVTAAHDATSTATPSSGLLVQANEVAFGIIASPYLSQFNGAANTAPTSWDYNIEQIALNVGSDRLPFQMISRLLAATTAISATWTHSAAAQGSAAAYATFKLATVTRRIRITGWDVGFIPAAATGVEARAFPGEPTSGGGTLYTAGGGGVTKIGNDMLLTPAPSGATVAQVFNCHLRNPTNGEASHDFVRGVVEDAS